MRAPLRATDKILKDKLATSGHRQTAFCELEYVVHLIPLHAGEPIEELNHCRAVIKVLEQRLTGTRVPRDNLEWRGFADQFFNKALGVSS